MITEQTDACGLRLAYLKGPSAIITVTDESWSQPVARTNDRLCAFLEETQASQVAVLPESVLRDPARAKYLPHCFKMLTSDPVSFVIVWFGSDPIPVFCKALWMTHQDHKNLSGIRSLRERFVLFLEQTKTRREFAGAELFFDSP